ncbi:V-set domain-containing T-cell activation inhibitor 1 [Alosa sapidissima]|uniref:V-set domain-containing T-cell activation inhibitor 1 n=1 Tax=Alosa sapidissima TaxID=34773 RepID=UPI001C09580A|nr:V-set domain-containing T-cell activation inhibitor 1 [Alosa sapidissima]
MAWTYELILVVLLWILKITEGQNAQVTCVISKRCMLPCTIEPHGGDVVIHWYQAKNNDNPVHSYYLGKDQPLYQDSRYRGRTSLFTDLISPGNASLSLTDVKIEDQGRYKCYTSTTKGNDEQFVDVEVEGPIKSVDITVVNDTLTCSSEGLYPTPTLDWSTDPPSQIQSETAETQSNAQGLFSITSSVKKTTSNSTYICTVTVGETTRTSSLKQQSLSAKEGEDLIIPCSVPGANANLKDFTLTWLFDGNAKVLTFDSRTSQSEAYRPWKGHVKYTDKETAITLHNLNDNTLSGRYSCEVVTTKFRHLEETEVFLQSERGPGGTHPAAIAVPAAVVVVIIVGLVGIVVKKKICDAKQDNTECELQTDKPSSETGNAESQKLTNGQ